MGVLVPGHWYCPTAADYASQIQAKVGSTSLKAWDALHQDGNGNFSQAFPYLGSKVILTGPPGADGTRPKRVVETRRCDETRQAPTIFQDTSGEPGERVAENLDEETLLIRREQST